MAHHETDGQIEIKLDRQIDRQAVAQEIGRSAIQKTNTGLCVYKDASTQVCINTHIAHTCILTHLPAYLRVCRPTDLATFPPTDEPGYP